MTTLHHTFDPIPLGSLDQLGDAQLQQQIWQALTDFPQWPRWFSGVDEVNLSDIAALGRGTRLSFSAGEFSDLLISHWHTNKRIDFVTQLSCGRIAVSIVFENSEASPRPMLCMRLELEPHGYWRFMSWPLFWRIKRKIVSHTQRFLECYQFSQD